MPFVRVIDLPAPYQTLADLTRSQEDTMSFLRQVSQFMHNPMLQAAGSCNCGGCGKPAVQLQITPQCFGNANQNYILVDPAVPLCGSQACIQASINLAKGVSQDARAALGGSNAMCAVCGATSSPQKGPLMLCAGCQAVHYCSVDCQRAAWPTHKSKCGV